MTAQRQLWDDDLDGMARNADQRRAIGMEQAAEHAGEAWQREALALARRYCESHQYVFVDNLWNWGLASSASDRALGAVIQYANKLGWIEKIPVPGILGAFAALPSVRSNLSPKPLWRSLIWDSFRARVSAVIDQGPAGPSIALAADSTRKGSECLSGD